MSSTIIRSALLVAAAAWLAAKAVAVLGTAVPAATPVVTDDAAPIPPTTDDFGGDGARFTRAADGHFYATARINAVDVRFLVDTGASMVALSIDDADRVGILVGDRDFTAAASTAHGDTLIAPVTIDRIEIGGTSIERVDAAVIDGYRGTSLLGQTYLSRFWNVSITGDVMTLR